MRVQHVLVAAAAVIALTFPWVLAASAFETCRQFVPGANMTIAVACPGSGSDNPSSDDNPGIAAVTPPPTDLRSFRGNPAIAVARDHKRCNEILERAQAGPVGEAETQVLRNNCRS